MLTSNLSSTTSASGAPPSDVSSMASQLRHQTFAPTSFSEGTTASQQQLPHIHDKAQGGQLGLLIVGLGGVEGCALLAAWQAQRLGIREWKGPHGNPTTGASWWQDCLTQKNSSFLPPGVKGVADASMAAIGGWDVRPTKIGDALYHHQLLDHDLVAQIKEDMNRVQLFRGVYDPRFDTKQQRSHSHSPSSSSPQRTDQEQERPDPTHILTEAEAQNDAQALQCLRADIRYFLWRKGIVGETTVMWAATDEWVHDWQWVESTIQTADQLLHLLQNEEQQQVQKHPPLPPSLLYATAALLEGCSYVHGGSGNDDAPDGSLTLWSPLMCPGLRDLAQRQNKYCLGNTWHTSSSRLHHTLVQMPHLGWKTRTNSSAASTHNQFREYTSHHNILGQSSTGLMTQLNPYSTKQDALSMVPGMMDVAVWCDWFSQRGWPSENVSRALGYLFQQPHSLPQQEQQPSTALLQPLYDEVIAAWSGNTGGNGVGDSYTIPATTRRSMPTTTDKSHEGSTRRTVRSATPMNAEWVIPPTAQTILCAGLACVDMQLHEATGGDGGEGIESFAGETSMGGGSVSMACKTIGRLCHGAPQGNNENGPIETAPAVSSVVPLCMIGSDDSGTKLMKLLDKCGSCGANVHTDHLQGNGSKTGKRTALSVLPIFQDGRRGCFFDAASNDDFTADHLLQMISDVQNNNSSHTDSNNASVGAMLFGYPHLLPQLQGPALARLLRETRAQQREGMILALDLNGVPDERKNMRRDGPFRSVHDLKNDSVIGPALEQVDLLHMNEDELVLLTGCHLFASEDESFVIAKATELFLECGVAVVAVTRGKQGSYVACNSAERFARSPMLPSSWVNRSAHVPAAMLPPGTRINTNGAGDSFTSGLLIATLLRRQHTGQTTSPPHPSATPPLPLQRQLSRDPSGSKNGGGSSRNTTIKTTTPITPYKIYIRENYVMLKQQYQGDKRAAIFARCHDMWEQESPEVKAMYQRMASEEEAAATSAGDAQRNQTMLDPPAANLQGSSSLSFEHATNQSQTTLNLESAVQFASLIAARHVDVSTRDMDFLDIDGLLEQAVFPSSPAEI